MTGKEWEKIARFYIGKYLQWKHVWAESDYSRPKNDEEEDSMPTCDPFIVNTELSKKRVK